MLNPDKPLTIPQVKMEFLENIQLLNDEDILLHHRYNLATIITLREISRNAEYNDEFLSYLSEYEILNVISDALIELYDIRKIIQNALNEKFKK